MRVSNVIAIAAFLVCALCVRALPVAAEDFAQVSDFAVSAVGDAQQPGVTEKGYFIYKMPPGGTSAGSLLVKNNGDKPLQVRLVVVPAMTAQNGGSTFGAPGSVTEGPGTWVKLAQSSLDLQPGTSSSVAFSVYVPASVRPGQYLAGIAAYKPKTEVTNHVTNGQDQATAILDVQMRYVVAVQVDVPGAWQADMAIPEVSFLEQPSGAFLGVRIENSGDTLLRPTGSIRVEDLSGNTVVERPINMGTFVTGTEVRYPVAWPSAPKPGSYKVRVELTYGEGKTAIYDRVVTVEPPQNMTPGQPATKQQKAQTRPAQNSANANAVPGAQDVTNSAAGDAAGDNEPWVNYGLGVLLLMVVVLLSLNLLVGRRHPKAI